MESNGLLQKPPVGDKAGMLRKKGARFTHSTHPFSGRIGPQLLCYSLLERALCKLEARVEATMKTIVEFAAKR